MRILIGIILYWFEAKMGGNPLRVKRPQLPKAEEKA